MLQLKNLPNLFKKKNQINVKCIVVHKQLSSDEKMPNYIKLITIEWITFLLLYFIKHF